jgi:hypothetical protein
MRGEPRSERISVLTTLTTKRNLDKVAMIQRTSANDVINTAIAEYLEKHKDEIERYNSFFGEE